MAKIDVRRAGKTAGFHFHRAGMIRRVQTEIG